MKLLVSIFCVNHLNILLESGEDIKKSTLETQDGPLVGISPAAYEGLLWPLVVFEVQGRLVGRGAAVYKNGAEFSFKSVSVFVVVFFFFKWTWNTWQRIFLDSSMDISHVQPRAVDPQALPAERGICWFIPWPGEPLYLEIQRWAEGKFLLDEKADVSRKRTEWSQQSSPNELNAFHCLSPSLEVTPNSTASTPPPDSSSRSRIPVLLNFQTHLSLHQHCAVESGKHNTCGRKAGFRGQVGKAGRAR